MIQPRSHSTVFSYGGVKLVGVLNEPASKRRAPAVLMLHGFPGAEKNVDIQRALLARGVGSLALHFAGAWGSEGWYTFSGLVPQARAALRFLARQEFVDPRRLALFGFSMGGWAAINAAPRELRLRAVAAVAPAGGPEMVGEKTLDFVTRASRPLRVRDVGFLVRDFSAAVRVFNPAVSAARLRCPLLLVHGDEDPVVPCGVSRRIAAASKAKLVVARGANHDFLDRRPWLTKVVVDWLVRRLR